MKHEAAVEQRTAAPRTLVELAERSFRAFRDRPLFGTKTGAGRKWTTYGEVQAAVDAFRSGLAALGVVAGERVAIVSDNRVEWAVAAYATYGLGAIFVPMYEQQLPREWEHILRDSGARVVIGSTARITGSLASMRARLPSLAHIIAIEAPEGAPDSFDAVLARGRASPVPATSPEPEAIAGFIYTSGTTGMPKGVKLSHANITSNVVTALSIFPFSPDDRMLSFLPWAHAYGQTELHIVLASGASSALVADITKLVEELGEARPTILVAVPRIFNKLHVAVMKEVAERPKLVERAFRAALATGTRLHRGDPAGACARLGFALADRLMFAKVRARLGGRLKYAISASATLSVQVAEAIDAMGIEVYEGFGLTETSPIVTANLPGNRKLGSVGRPIPGVTVNIDETRGGLPGSGEIIVHGPNVMCGYHERPEENAQTFTADGGLRTGDLGYLDADGFLYITGRIKEQYKLENGKYVMPSPLEEQLKLSPYILNVMLHGDGHPHNVALVVIDAGAVRAWAKEEGHALEGDLTADPRVHALIDGELARLAAPFRAFERPRGSLLITEDFTVQNGLLTPSLKLKRREVLARHRPALEALYHATSPSVAA